jgi:hypothetical protein
MTNRPDDRERSGVWILAAAVWLLAGCGLPATDSSQPVETKSAALVDRTALAFAWAPIHYQNVTKTGEHGITGMADDLLAFDYDGDFDGRNNWDHLGYTQFSLAAHIYYAISESDSHWFIYYMMFHARDWDNTAFMNQHENDFEGVVMLVRKDGTTFGTLEAGVSSADEYFRSFRATPNIGWSSANWYRATTLPTITTESWGYRAHPQMYQAAEGHQLNACTNSHNCGIVSDDSVRYLPFDPSQGARITPFPIPDGTTVDVGYTLIDISDLYSRRFDWPTFADRNTLAGDSSGGCQDYLAGLSCSDNAARGVWAQGDAANASLSANSLIGEDPAAFFAGWFSFNNGLTPPSGNYVSNSFLHPKCDVGRRMQGSPDACVQQICAPDQDPYCCTNTWDATCVSEVASMCGLWCGAAGTCDDNKALCSVSNSPRPSGCDSRCQQTICAPDKDPYCCTNSWDAQCVGEVASMCHLPCP